jgi:hypothetical protein
MLDIFSVAVPPTSSISGDRHKMLSMWFIDFGAPEGIRDL